MPSRKAFIRQRSTYEFKATQIIIKQQPIQCQGCGKCRTSEKKTFPKAVLKKLFSLINIEKKFIKKYEA